ncbi:rhodanese-like domain-containing protein [Campylobacter fetus]|uniref:Thiosulfate sulfurtransferase n=1 Tax=Campylobacter fetus subsp. testudinum TaxID=1507806 RepID=A0AAX0H9E9_CAMFE|nr:rhodanese-like domain-containing protein [Campylobacter fetus]AGZ81812.2 putative rhodanese-related sulfurtransferase [Campylobacter fetus subsp. testudinum 03-427]AJB45544.1 thiosulfate sulfurtransferase [Campylobacter fetus subsp. testudinum]ALV64968.2 putative rhodanese-related sulfurtransferase [Campylobacter fetus subsp. testudinum Sp3]AVK81214.1 rhodanese-like domain-containing protein [Campylobacter fetus subsp. testudinum]EAI4321212.1 rhodanese-like domain-containing protein [Campyl
MKKILLILMTLSIYAFGEVVTVDFNEEILNDKDIQIVDVRTPSEWAQTGVLKGAVLVTYKNSDGSINPNFVNEVKSKLNPDKKVAVICRSGNRSRPASALLDEGGVKNVINIDGGMNKVVEKNIATIKP